MGTKSNSVQSTARSEKNIRRDIHNLRQKLSRRRHPLSEEQLKWKRLKYKVYYQANKVKINNQRKQKKSNNG